MDVAISMDGVPIRLTQGRWFHIVENDDDREADVLCISFAHPQQATDTDMTDEGFLLRYRDDRIVGVTVLDASTRLRRGPS